MLTEEAPDRLFFAVYMAEFSNRLELKRPRLAEPANGDAMQNQTAFLCGSGTAFDF